MQLSEVMTPSPQIINPAASVADAAAMMKELNVGALPVCDNDTVIGLVTDRDITVRATAEHRDPDSALVREVMSPRVVFCLENDDVEVVPTSVVYRREAGGLLPMPVCGRA